MELSLAYDVFVSLPAETVLDMSKIDVDALSRYSDHNNREHTAHILKYIFPREFGLDNVFTCSVGKKETAHAFKDYTLREHEIAAWARSIVNITTKARPNGGRKPSPAQVLARVPRRLRGVVKLVQKLQRLQTKCAYLQLLKHYCPSSVSNPCLGAT